MPNAIFSGIPSYSDGSADSPPGQSRPVIPSIPSLIVGNDRMAFDKYLIGMDFGILFSIRGLQVSPVDSAISGENRF